MSLETRPAFIRALSDAPDLVAAVRAAALRAPGKPFMILELAGSSLAISYGRLVARAEDFARAFQARDLGAGSPIVILLVAHADLAPAFLGAMMLGAVPSIFPPSSAKQDKALFWSAQAEVFERVGATLVVTDAAQARELADHMPGAPIAVLDIDGVPERGPGAPGLAPGTALPEIAFLQHSSGTTGTKKGVILTHRAVLDFAASLATALQAREDDVIASWLPLYHDMGLIGCLILPMVLGLTIVQMEPFEWVGRPAMLLESIQRNRATLSWMPNFAFHHIMRTTADPSAYDLSSMRAFIDCSEPCKPDTLAAFAERFAPAGLARTALQVSYGMAENVFIATQTDMTAVPRAVRADMEAFSTEGAVREPEEGAAALSFVSVGPPIPDTSVRILDPDLDALPDRRVGQIAVTSPYLFTGYHRQPYPASKMSEGWYLTGDLGFTIDGEVFVCGRMDDLMIVNGRNIYAHDVEYAVNQHTAVKGGRCVAVAPFNARVGSQSLVVIAETADPAPAARRDLARSIRSLVQTVFGVTVFDVRVMDPGWLVKTTSGKIGRGVNERKYLAEFPLT